MNNHWLQRTHLLLGEQRTGELQEAKILIAGTGGVGSFAAEMLCRAGIGTMAIVDSDTVNLTNINRQIPALHSTIGKPKVEVLAQRLLDINPELNLKAHGTYLTDSTTGQLLDEGFDFVIDAIDTIAPKCDLIVATAQRGINIISSMGAGAKTDPSEVKITDLWKTANCGLAKAVRAGLRKRGFRGKLPVVHSNEKPDAKAIVIVDERNKKSTAGTISYMPAIFGCYLAAYVIKHIRK